MVSTLRKQKKDCFIKKGVKNGNSSSDWRWNCNIKSIWVNNQKNQRTFNQLSKRFFDVYSVKLWFMFNVYRNLMRNATKLIKKHPFSYEKWCFFIPLPAITPKTRKILQFIRIVVYLAYWKWIQNNFFRFLKNTTSLFYGNVIFNTPNVQWNMWR